MQTTRCGDNAHTTAGLNRYRVLIGTFDTGLITDFATGFRALGHNVTTVSCRPPRFHSELTYDVDISPGAASLISWPQWILESRFILIRIPRGAINRLARAIQIVRLVITHDVFVFQCGGISLTAGNREYPLLKFLGKRIVAAFMGGEVRNIDAYEAQYGTESVTPELRADCLRRGHDLALQARALRMAEAYADVVLSQPNQSTLAIRRYSHLFIPLDLARYEWHIPDRDVPIVVHAPSCRATKGTAQILQAIDRLKGEGIPFEFKLLEGVPNEVVLQELRDADILVDQIVFNYHGKLTLEGMALGCAVASCNDELNEPFPQDRPIWHIDLSNVYEQLKVLLTDRTLRLRLAAGGRPYVDTYHAPAAVATRIAARLASQNDDDCEHRPTFFLESYRAADTTLRSDILVRLTTTIAKKSRRPATEYREVLERRGLLQGNRNLTPRFRLRGRKNSVGS